MNERILAESLALIEVIHQTADAEVQDTCTVRLLSLHGWTPSPFAGESGAPSYIDASGSGASHPCSRALAIVTREVRDAVAELAGRAA